MLETASEWIIQTSFDIFAILGLICILQAVSPSLIPPPCQHSDVVRMTPSSKTNTFTFCTYRAAALQRHKCINFTVIILFCRQNFKTESKTLEHRSCWLGCGFCVVRGIFYLFFPQKAQHIVCRPESSTFQSGQQRLLSHICLLPLPICGNVFKLLNFYCSSVFHSCVSVSSTPSRRISQAISSTIQ